MIRGMMTTSSEQYKRFVGDKLRQAREALNLSQSDLAREFNLGDKSKVSHWERGLYYPDQFFIFQLYLRKQIPPSWIYLGDKSQVPYGIAILLKE